MKTQTVYLLHFNESNKGCRHYHGSVINLPARLKHHLKGTGARWLKAVKAAGISWVLVRTWSGDRQLERKLKDHKKSSDYCPVCQATKAINSKKYEGVRNAHSIY